MVSSLFGSPEGDPDGSVGGSVLLAGSALVWMMSSTFSSDEEQVLAFAAQAGSGKQAVLGKGDRVGDDPRLLIDFNTGQPLLSAGGRSVGDRQGADVRINGRQFHIHRNRWRERLRPGLRLEVRADDRLVLQVREVSRADSTVHRYVVGRTADLDPIHALAMILLEARPDRMGLFGELRR